MNGDDKAAAQVIAVSRGVETPWQFVLAVGEALVLGRAVDCDVVLPNRGVSGRHAILRHLSSPTDSDAVSEIHLEDCSTNGTGISTGSGDPWLPLRKGESRVVGGELPAAPAAVQLQGPGRGRSAHDLCAWAGAA